jgi:hypothetical protein
MKRLQPSKLVDRGKSKSRKSKKQRATEAPMHFHVHKNPMDALVAHYKSKEK